VATRFAGAYLLYQIGREPRTVVRMLRRTCTPGFARTLLTAPVSIPPVQRARPAAQPAALQSVTYTGPATLGPGAPVQLVIARYHIVGHPTVGGRLTIEIRGGGQGWRVTGLR
jgi:hypothetical protein